MSKANYQHSVEIRSARFLEDESVLQSVPLLTGYSVPRFGQSDVWDLNAWERNPNLAPAFHRIFFKAPSERWNLRLREVAMVMFNPAHSQVRAAGVFQPMTPSAVSTVRAVVGSLRMLAEWAIEQGLGEDPSAWTEGDLDRFLEERGTRNKVKHYRAIRNLHRYHPILTDGGLTREPWAGASIEALMGYPSRGKKVKTEAIPPEVWWPLLRAAWKYIDIFSDDILKARSRWEQLTRTDSPELEPKLSSRELVVRWLNDPDNVIPLHPRRHYADKSPLEAGGRHVNWSLLSLMITHGRSRMLFSGTKNPVPAIKAAVKEHVHQRARTFDLLPDAQLIDAPDGVAAPWVRELAPSRMWHETVVLRTACYIFVAALSMQRDSELQGILRNSVVQHYGAPAIRSRKFKQDPSKTDQHWWIIEPVAQALAVAEALSTHPTRVFATVRRTDMENGVIWAHKDLRKFVKHVNAHHAELGLEEIPDHRLAPHMFRKTMSVITRQQPDGEIALGLTLKHAAIRALSNATTTGYAEPTPEWAEELQISLADATAVRLARLMSGRNSGETVAVGPGAGAFTAKLDKITAALGKTAEFEGSIVDERTIRKMLRSEFSTVKFGNLNACLGDLSAALCLTPRTAGGSPAINPSRCQPHLCRNSVVTSEHRPYWVATEQDLLEALRDRRMSKTNRAALRQELADVRKVISSAEEDSEAATR